MSESAPSDPSAALVDTEALDNGVVVITLRNPPVNSLSTAVLGEVASVAEGLARDAPVHAVVVRGDGKVFAAGADISEFGGPDEARTVTSAFRSALDALGAIRRPTIAAIHGVALGGGLELALACDLRAATDSARVGQPENLLGIIPGGGATQRLTRLVGPARAKELVWSGRQVRADEALSIGIVDRVVDVGDGDAASVARDAAVEWAGELAGGAVVAMGLAKQAIDAGLDGTLGDGLDREAAAFVEVFGTEDASTGVASFLESGPGKAEFRGR
ncbi:MAG: enoyl-CoA hydratase-related protein [Acidimicrobiia bacterium]|nr:enoyl-CoA hydratase-related protein [Acidimicrobiia bacterium]